MIQIIGFMIGIYIIYRCIQLSVGPGVVTGIFSGLTILATIFLLFALFMSGVSHSTP